VADAERGEVVDMLGGIVEGKASMKKRERLRYGARDRWPAGGR
jgi:hypothetical protein